MDVLAIIFTDGVLTHGEMQKECKSGKWIPILLYKDGESKIVPIFTDEQICKNFIKRNLPKDWNHGAIILSENNIDFLENKGCKFRNMTYPNKIPFEKMTFEILELETVPDFHVGYLKS